MKQLKQFINEKLHVSNYKKKFGNINKIIFTQFSGKTSTTSNIIDSLHFKEWKDKDIITEYIDKYMYNKDYVFMFIFYNDTLKSYYNPGVAAYMQYDEKIKKFVGRYINDNGEEDEAQNATKQTKDQFIDYINKTYTSKKDNLIDCILIVINIDNIRNSIKKLYEKS